MDRSEKAVTLLHADLYRHAVEHGGIDPDLFVSEVPSTIDEILQACKVLEQLRLLVSTGAGQGLVPVHPNTAVELLNEPLKSEIRSRQQTIDDNERLLREFTVHVAGLPPIVDVTLIRDPAQVAELREAAAARCTSEVLVAQLGLETDLGVLERSAAGYDALGVRGVTSRLIFQHVSRSSLKMRGYFRTVQRYGAAVSTSSESFEPMAIYDRCTAFIPLDRSDGSAGSIMVTSAPVIDYLCRVFERLWTGALPFEDADSAHELAFSDDRVLLLRLLAAGLKDDAIANRLGIAVRTCRRYIASLLLDLGASSRFQAGVRAGQLGLLPAEPASGSHATAWVDAHPLS